MKILRLLLLVPGMLVFSFSLGSPVRGQDPEPVVHAILFYHPGCPHCHQLIREHLIPLQEQYGDRLVLLGMDTSQQWANNLYYEAMRYYRLPEEDWVVPILIVDDQVMVGGNEIPSRLPGIIENGLASGGIDLPDFPALISFLREQNALDTRYPDRRIARQASPAEEEGAAAGDSAQAPPEEAVEEPEPEEVPVEGEAVAAGDSSANPGDTLGLEEDPQRGEPQPGAEEAASPGDSGASRSSGAPGDTAVSSGPTPHGEGANPSRDSVSPGDSAPGAARSGAPEPWEPRPGAAGAAGQGGVGAMDLEQAARDLESWSMWDRFNQDRAGNTLSVLVLLVMFVVVALRGYPPRVEARDGAGWAVPVLVLVGAGVAAYLSFVEVTTTEAVCGPVGDCNTVNQSEYAFLFGVLPVGLLGLMGYGLILGLWLARLKAPGSVRRMATLGLWGAALFGTFFSIYLTFLEPFVIGATCIWCLTSAVVMALLLWIASPLAAGVWTEAGEGGTAG